MNNLTKGWNTQHTFAQVFAPICRFESKLVSVSLQIFGQLADFKENCIYDGQTLICKLQIIIPSSWISKHV